MQIAYWLRDLEKWRRHNARLKEATEQRRKRETENEADGVEIADAETE